MKTQAELTELLDFIGEYATYLLGSGVHTSRSGRIDPSVGRKNRILRFFGGQSNFFRFFSLDLLEY